MSLIRPFGVLIATLLLLTCLISAAGAAASEIGDERTAFEAAVQLGDTHEALVHIERAYNLSRETGVDAGPESLELALELGRTQNALLNFEGAGPILANAIDEYDIAGLPDDQLLFELLIEHGKALLCLNNALVARDQFTRALTISEATAGSNSRDAGIAHFFLAVTPVLPLVYSTEAGGEGLIYPSIYRFGNNFAAARSTNEFFAGRIIISDEVLAEASAHLDAAQPILATTDPSEAWIARSDLVRMAIQANGQGHANLENAYQNAIDDLVEIGFADEIVVRLAFDWLARTMSWQPRGRETERNIHRLERLSVFRVNGGPIPILKNGPAYPIRAANRRETGTVCIGFFVNEVGEVVDDYIVQSASTILDNASRHALREFIFAPEMRNGHPVHSGELRHCFEFQIQ